ncbi:CHAT domain-containing protein [Flammeovirga sp. MY04]|uniref:CHAT domain-containing tetratricopeptide repeat protein n=1 Tax=Flammeovirga sp. MY04 TaxID=1191459 RepID=UPI0008060E8F|nr:CHAT domain-containing protein [Flammeovirga sp. MY04]ANQ51509.1 CHAT domain-containing protein [Flammeovirga sp. MY04]
MIAKRLFLLISFIVTSVVAQDKEYKTKELRAMLPEMIKEREEMKALRLKLTKENDDWKTVWVKQVVPTLKNKNFYIRAVDAEILSGFNRFKTQPELDKFLINHLPDLEHYLFTVKMDKKESFEELQEIYKMVRNYHWLQNQVSVTINPLQKLADDFFYRTPFIERLEALYASASEDVKKEKEDFYDDVILFWGNCKSQSNNFDRIIQEHLAAGTLDNNTILMLVGKMYNTNQYYIATKLVKGAIEEIEKNNDTSSYHYGAFLLNLSSLYMMQEDYENMLAVQLKQKELNLFPNEAMLIYNYQMLGMNEEALQLADEFLQKNDVSNPLYLGTLGTKISVLQEMENYESAKEASLLLIKLSKENKIDISSSTYFTLSKVYSLQKDTQNALKYGLMAYERSIEEFKILPELDPNNTTSLLYVRIFKFYYYINYVGTLVEAGQKDKIDFNKLIEEYNHFEYLIKNIMLNPSKMDKKQVVKISEDTGDIIYTLAEKYPTTASKQLAYNYTLLSKEIGLSSVIAIRKYAADSKDKDLKNLFEHWMRVRKEILFKDENIDIDSLKDIAFGLQKELSIKTRKEVFSQIEENDVDFKMVKKALKPKEVAIEFVYYAPNKYAALVLRSNMQSPEFVPLFDESDLTALLPPEDRQKEQWLIDFIYNRNSYQIAKLVVDPLRPYLSDVKTIYYSPAGILHGLSLDAIKSENKEKRFGEEYKLKRLSKTSQIAQKTILSPRKATIFGGMNYNKNAFNEITGESGERGLELNTKASKKAQKEEIAVQKVGGVFTYLPGTFEEANLINTELQTSKLEVNMYTGNEATEDQFKAFCKQPTDILHLATHAYFTPYIPKEKIAEGSYKGTAEICSDPDPMNRAGIVFSGANYFWETGKSYEGKENGILMASELSNYDLRATKLAIVSACQSGIGQSTRSEGVYGFQRAIKLAGIEHQIISLWIVDDAATQKFMTHFYKYYIELSDIGEAVEKAKNELKKEYDHPYFWAAFVHVR